MKLEIRGENPKEETCELWLDKEDGTVVLKSRIDGSYQVLCRIYKTKRMFAIPNSHFEHVTT